MPPSAKNFVDSRHDPPSQRYWKHDCVSWHTRAQSATARASYAVALPGADDQEGDSWSAVAATAAEVEMGAEGDSAASVCVSCSRAAGCSCAGAARYGGASSDRLSQSRRWGESFGAMWVVKSSWKRRGVWNVMVSRGC